MDAKRAMLTHFESALSAGAVPMVARRTGRNQLTITAHTLDAFPDADDYAVVIADGKIVLTPVAAPPGAKTPDPDPVATPCLTEADIPAIVSQVRAERRSEDARARRD